MNRSPSTAVQVVNALPAHTPPAVIEHFANHHDTDLRRALYRSPALTAERWRELVSAKNSPADIESLLWRNDLSRDDLRWLVTEVGDIRPKTVQMLGHHAKLDLLDDQLDKLTSPALASKVVADRAHSEGWKSRLTDPVWKHQMLNVLGRCSQKLAVLAIIGLGPESFTDDEIVEVLRATVNRGPWITSTYLHPLLVCARPGITEAIYADSDLTELRFDADAHAAAAALDAVEEALAPTDRQRTDWFHEQVMIVAGMWNPEVSGELRERIASHLATKSRGRGQLGPLAARIRYGTGIVLAQEKYRLGTTTSTKALFKKFGRQLGRDSFAGAYMGEELVQDVVGYRGESSHVAATLVEDLGEDVAAWEFALTLLDDFAGTFGDLAAACRFVVA